MRGKEEKKGRGKEEKKRRKGGEKMGTKSQKKKKKKKERKKKKKKSVRIFYLFPLRSLLFLDQSEICYLEKSTLYLPLFSCKIFSMNKLCDFKELKIHPHPLFCNTSKILWQS